MLALLLGIVSAEQCDSGGYPRIVIGCWQLLEREQEQSQAVATLQARACTLHVAQTLHTHCMHTHTYTA